MRISRDDLDQLVRLGPHAADELPKMLKALGIDEADLARTEPLLLRDMERVCTLCSHKRQCDRELAAGTATEHYEGYCLNASTIDGLGEQTVIRHERSSQQKHEHSPRAIIRIGLAAAVILAAILFVHLHNANGASRLRQRLRRASPGAGLVQGLSRHRCHDRGRGRPSPDFAAIANRPSTTALSLKVFFNTSHRNMPNLVIAPDQADDLASYILSLKRN